MFGKKRSEGFEKPTRKVTPMGGTAAESSKATEASPRLGETTLEFFKEGEQHEAAEWRDVLLPPDDEPVKDPKVKFKSFDKIAKRRSSTVALLVMTVGLVVAVGLGVVAALRTEHVLSSSLGSYFGFGGHASGTQGESGHHPVALPPPLLMPDAGLPSLQPPSPDASADALSDTAPGRSR